MVLVDMVITKNWFCGRKSRTGNIFPAVRFGASMAFHPPDQLCRQGQLSLFVLTHATQGGMSREDLFVADAYTKEDIPDAGNHTILICTLVSRSPLFYTCMFERTLKSP